MTRNVPDALSAQARAASRLEVERASTALVYKLAAEGPPDATLEFPAGGGTLEHAISVPALPEMDGLIVTQAQLALTGVAVDAPWISVGHASSDAPAELARPAPEPGEALLSQIRIEGLSAGPELRLGGVMLQGEATGATRELRVVLSVFAGGKWSPPSAAAPAFGPPAGSQLYPAMLAGMSLTMDAASLTAALSLLPPLRCSKVRVLLLKDADEDVSPTTSQAVAWSASSVQARWRTTPTQLELSLVEAGSSSAQALGALPGLSSRMELDLAGALHGMLSRQQAANPAGAPTANLRLHASSAGKVEVRTSLAAWYKKSLEPTPAVALRGSPSTLRRVGPRALVPRACGGTLHAEWGPARLVANADRAEAAAQSGVSLRGTRRLARWLTLTSEEAERGLLRLSLYARALESAELMLAIYSGDESVVGRSIGRPVAVAAEPLNEPDWLRAELAGVRLSGRTGIWVVAWVSRGAVQVYGRSGSCRVSPDAGETWAVAATQPLVQVHYDASGQALAPLTLRAGQTLVDSNLRARGAVEPKGMLVDLAPVLGANALRAALDPAGVFTLSCSCDQDVDLSPVDLALLYDPWRRGES